MPLVLPSQVWWTPVSAGFPGRHLAYPTPFHVICARSPVIRIGPPSARQGAARPRRQRLAQHNPQERRRRDDEAEDPGGGAPVPARRRHAVVTGSRTINGVCGRWSPRAARTRRSRVQWAAAQARSSRTWCASRPSSASTRPRNSRSPTGGWPIGKGVPPARPPPAPPPLDGKQVSTDGGFGWQTSGAPLCDDRSTVA